MRNQDYLDKTQIRYYEKSDVQNINDKDVTNPPRISKEKYKRERRKWLSMKAKLKLMLVFAVCMALYSPIRVYFGMSKKDILGYWSAYDYGESNRKFTFTFTEDTIEIYDKERNGGVKLKTIVPETPKDQGRVYQYADLAPVEYSLQNKPFIGNNKNYHYFGATVVVDEIGTEWAYTFVFPRSSSEEEGLYDKNYMLVIQNDDGKINPHGRIVYELKRIP